jgi:hypothetical protein
MSTFVKQTDEHRADMNWGEKRDNDQGTKITQLAQKSKKQTKQNNLRTKQTQQNRGKDPSFMEE